MSDPIDRQEALDALRTCYDTNLIVLDNGDELIHYGDAVGAIEALPSAQPEEDCETCKHGRFGDAQCNTCRVRFLSHYERDGVRGDSNDSDTD